MTVAELRAKSKEELVLELKKLRAEQTKKREDLIKGKDKKTSGVSLLRKDIARVSTILKEKEI